MSITGNTYSGHIHPKTAGSGIGRQGSAFGRVKITGKAGQVVRISTSGIASSVCQYQAILVQALGTGVTVACTLEDPDLACDPRHDGNIWSAGEAIASGELKALTPPTASAIKITFTAKGYAIIALT